MQMLTSESIERLFEQLLQPIRLGEVGSVFCPPVSGRDYRIANFMESLAGTQTSLKLLNLTAERITDSEDVVAFFEGPAQHADGVIITPAESLLNLDLVNVLEAIININREKHIGMLFFFDCFPSELTKVSNLAHDLLQHEIFHPLYAEKDTLQFLTMLSKRWNIHFAPKEVHRIYQHTGGHTWLLKEVARQKAEGDTDLASIFSSRGYQYRVSVLWQKIPNSHQLYLREVCKNQGFNLSSRESDDLERLGFISTGFAKVVPGFIQEAVALQPTATIEYRSGQVLINQVNVTALFSKGEKRLLSCFLRQKGVIKSREELGKAYWPNLQDYSDWALDQAIARLRGKFKKLSVDSGVIVTVKNRGYILRT